MLVVLGQRHDVAFRRHSQAAAAAHLHIGTLKVCSHCTTALQHHNVEAIAMAVSNENVARVTRVNPVWIRCQRLVAKTTDKFTILRKHSDTVTL